uniref:C2H2-type domain-containing protein n=1 Tax=Ditylenchus dipsaci TaxID=166011 RepID=A0A915CLM1_9BILA
MCLEAGHIRKFFESVDGIELHLARDHLEISLFECSECPNARFSTELSLVQHTKLVHKHTRPVKINSYMLNRRNQCKRRELLLCIVKSAQLLSKQEELEMGYGAQSQLSISTAQPDPICLSDSEEQEELMALVAEEQPKRKRVKLDPTLAATTKSIELARASGSRLSSALSPFSRPGFKEDNAENKPKKSTSAKVREQIQEELLESMPCPVLSDFCTDIMADDLNSTVQTGIAKNNSHAFDRGPVEPVPVLSQTSPSLLTMTQLNSAMHVRSAVNNGEILGESTPDPTPVFPWHPYAATLTQNLPTLTVSTLSTSRGHKKPPVKGIMRSSKPVAQLKSIQRTPQTFTATNMKRLDSLQLSRPQRFRNGKKSLEKQQHSGSSQKVQKEILFAKSRRCDSPAPSTRSLTQISPAYSTRSATSNRSGASSVNHKTPSSSTTKKMPTTQLLFKSAAGAPIASDHQFKGGVVGVDSAVVNPLSSHKGREK